MPGFVPDTSCMVAALCAWHDDHQSATSELNRRLSQRQSMILAAPALVEAYAVLTRLPPPHRLSPNDALRLLDGSFMSAGRTVALDAASYRGILRQAASDAVAGGRAYDVVIARCALKGRASTLLTFNAKDFLSVSLPGIDIVVPGASSSRS